MTFTEFIQQLAQRLDFLSPKKREQTLIKYRRLFEDAKQLGIEETAFVAGLGSIDTIVAKLRNEQIVPDQSSTTATQLKKSLVYLLAIVIAVAIGFLMFGLFSFGLSYFVFGITKLIQNASVSQAAYALYIGQMLIGAGIWVILIGYLTKSRGNFNCLVKKLNQAIIPNKGGPSHE
ncbi:MAG TPA: hypothetical protein PK340_00530 [Bacilli bacterium]|nr:hypothetical protein [Bacilli bacterium]